MKRVFGFFVLLILVCLLAPPLFYAIFPEEFPDLPDPGRRVRVSEALAINVVEEGSGPAVVLVHGLPGSAYDWQALLPELAARGLRVLAYDRVGYAHSDARIDGDFSVAANARDLVGLLAAEDLRDVTLVGWSYGAPVALQAAGMAPGRIARLVLVGAGGTSEEFSGPPEFVEVLFAGPVISWLKSVPPLGRGLQREMSSQAFSGQEPPDWWLPLVEANFSKPATLQTFLGEGAGVGAEPMRPDRVAQPILLIHGEEDRLAPILISEWIHKQVPEAGFWRVEGGSHMLPVTHAAPLADRIEEFVRRD